MDSDDSFFNPRAPAPPATLYLPTPDDDSDMSADMTLFGDGARAVEAYRQQVRATARHDAREHEHEHEHEAHEHEHDVQYETYEAQYETHESQYEQYEDEAYEQDMDSSPQDSSREYSPDMNPAGFAERLDELAGILEVGEEEARAVRWGPDLSGEDVPLSIDEFREVLHHHLAATEWRYEMVEKVHPIPVLGASWAGRRIVQNDEEMFRVPA
ncbi:hypothetical protein CC85DRAFT_284891, partial [Cutaneotrichosporon oleaginosum]